jgi:hypothetical protein
VDLTSDPHAWLRPYYVALKADGGLQKLAVPLRFEALCCAVEGEYPSRAASMREWSPAAKTGILGDVVASDCGRCRRLFASPRSELLGSSCGGRIGFGPDSTIVICLESEIATANRYQLPPTKKVAFGSREGRQSNVARSAPAGDVPAGAAVNVYLGAVPVTTES